MDTIQALFLDNDDDAFETYSRHMKFYWRQLFKSEINFTHEKTIEGALAELELPENKYQLLISDMLFPPMDEPNAPSERHEPRALEVLKIARKKEKLLIVGLSIGSTRFKRLHEDAVRDGAHLFKYRNEIVSPQGMGIEGFCQEIYGHLLQMEIIKDSVELKYNDKEPKIAYIVSEISVAVLKSLYKQLLEEQGSPEHLEAKYLAPGMSGAFVLKVEAKVPRQPPVSHLLKVSRSKERLLKELRNYPKSGPYSNRLLVQYLGSDKSGIPQVGEWFAIGAVFEPDAKTIRQWLLDKPEPGEIANVMHSLFLGGGLRKGCTTDLGDKGNALSVVEALSPNLSRQARIHEALEEFKEVIIAPELGGETDWDQKASLITRFLSSQQIGIISAKETPDECYMCLCHGDLHSRNVLVTAEPTPVAIIIDTSEFGIYHWAVDYVRLLVDLVLASYDQGVRSHLWNHIAHWREVAQSIVRLNILSPDLRDGGTQDGTTATTNLSVVTAIQWMTANVANVCPAIENEQDLKIRMWELQLALAVEFMRGSYRLDLTVPKRVFSLLAAYDALLAAEASFKETHREI
jgi:Phosphotransferase enzyme family